MGETKTKQLIFLAEDDQDNCALFREALQSVNADCRLELCMDGVELMQKLNEPEEVLPDVIFLDLNMPRKNGWESLSEIKKETRLSAIPVIIFSTASCSREIKRVYDAGADLFVVKPDCFKKLIAIIRDILYIDIRVMRQQQRVFLY